MKIRRPDADKARKHLERQHMDAAARAAQVVRPRRAPGGMPSVVTLAEAMDPLVQTTQPVVDRMLQAAMNLPVPETFQGKAAG